jgi:hypothetical protein
MFCTGGHVQNAEGKWSHVNDQEDPLQACPQCIALRRAGVVSRHSLVGLSPPASCRVRQARSTDAIMSAGWRPRQRLTAAARRRQVCQSLGNRRPFRHDECGAAQSSDDAHARPMFVWKTTLLPTPAAELTATPCTWNTDLAMSRPIVVIVWMFSSSESWER